MTTISHKNLAGTQLHELKGVAAATDNFVPVAISGATSWQKLTASNLTGTGNSFGGQLLRVRDERTNGTAGSNSVSGAYTTRVLNTSVTNEISGASLTSNQITLPAGTYYIDADLTGYACAANKARFKNITDNSTVIVGTSEYGATAGGSCHSVVKGRFTIAGTKVFEVQHWTVSSTPAGFGAAVSDGAFNEVYADVCIWKIA